MAKTYFYQCVYPCEVGFLAPDHRKERIPPNVMVAPMVLHTFTLYPADPYNPKKQADVLIVDRPLADHYVNEVPKVVSRKNLRTGEREDHETHSKIKFVLVPDNEVTDDMRKRGRRFSLTEQHYAPVAKAKAG